MMNPFWDDPCPACHDMREMCRDCQRMEGSIDELVAELDEVGW
jgi:hypothetical protein